MARCRFVFSKDYYSDIGPHVFPMEKFDLVYRALRRDGDIREDRFIEPQPASLTDLHRVHTEEYLADLLSYHHTSRTQPSELPISERIVTANILMAGGTLLACRKALEDGLAMNLGGGFHHAFPDHAEGFCYLNDIAIGIRGVQAEKCARRVAVIDLDVHQGNGTAVIFQDDPDVFTFSMHQENNYPLKRASRLDVGLDDGAGDEEYLRLLSEHLPRILDGFHPALVVYVAGADVFEHDQLGGLRLTLDGMRTRDETVIHNCRRRGIPVAAVLAGGYATRLDDTIQAHHNTARVMLECETDFP